MRRQASGAPRAPTADLESPLGLVVGGRCPCSLPRCGWLHCRPLSGSADFLRKAFSGQAQGGPLRPHQPQGRGRLQQGKARTAVWLLLVTGLRHKPRPSPRFRKLYVQW
jgi:hypothetical protein